MYLRSNLLERKVEKRVIQTAAHEELEREVVDACTRPISALVYIGHTLASVYRSRLTLGGLGGLVALGLIPVADLRRGWHAWVRQHLATHHGG